MSPIEALEVLRKNGLTLKECMAISRRLGERMKLGKTP